MKLKLTIIALSLISLVSFAYAFYLYAQRHIEIPAYAYEIESDRLFPTRLVIDSLELDLPIYEAEIVDERWESTKKGVSYLSTTPLPGETGNSVIYGHNWPNLLGNLNKIENGADMQVFFSDGTSKVFRVQDKSNVTSDQTHILDQGDSSKLTIYTCNNFLDSKRFVVVATPVLD